VGGIQTASHLQARMDAGAELVQVHTALLHQGPWLARHLLRYASTLRQKRQRPGPAGALSK
jgi:dihydroorotate dehydrogenase